MIITAESVEHVTETGVEGYPFALRVKVTHGYLGHESLLIRLTEAQWASLYHQGMVPLMAMRAQRNTK